MSDDNQESYLKNLKDYRDKKIHLGIWPSNVDTYFKENRLDGIINGQKHLNYLNYLNNSEI